MKLLRKLLYFCLGLKGYLIIISYVYIKLIRWGIFKKKYSELHYLKNIVKEGNICIDIGANLGYYSYFLCKLVGKKGKVYAVEPIPVFRDILKRNVGKKSMANFEILPYALGESEKIITMGMPIVDGIIHHGMTHVLNDDDNKEIAKTFEVEMKIPDKLFENIDKIDFIKCDVEGYENLIFSNMQQCLKKHKPIIQCELSERNKEKTIELFRQIGYETYVLKNFKLQKVENNELKLLKEDVYFLPQ